MQGLYNKINFYSRNTLNHLNKCVINKNDGKTNILNIKNT